MPRSTLFALIAVVGLAAGPALAADRCSVPKAEWQPREALQKKLETQGWTIKRMDTEDGCYEVYALDQQGRRVEAYFNPKTLEPVSTKVEG